MTKRHAAIPLTPLRPMGTTHMSHAGRFCYVPRDGKWHVYDVEERTWFAVRDSFDDARSAADFRSLLS